MVKDYIQDPWENSCIYPQLTDRATEVADRLMRMQFVTMSEIMVSINNNAPLRAARTRSSSGKEQPEGRDHTATFPDMSNRKMPDIFLNMQAPDPPQDPPTMPEEKLPWQERNRIIPRNVASTGKRLQELQKARTIKTDILYDD